ncbi:unnamed protein product, partial [Prorocentrum cordatum]
HAGTVSRGTLLSRASAWPDDLGTTLVRAGAHELARRTELKQLGVGGGVPKVPDKEAMRTVAMEFKLRKDLIDVRVLQQKEAVPLPGGAVRRIHAMCTDKGVLADFSDACAGDPNFTKVELATRCLTRTVVAIYVKGPKVQTSLPARAPLLGSRLKAFKPDDREADAVHRDLHRECESFGDKPSDITTAQWGALRKLHLNQSHPSARALKRLLKSYGVSQRVLDVVDKPECVVCKQLGRPNAAKSANLMLSTELSENVFLDEAEVLYYVAAKGRVAQHFADIGAKCNILMSTCNNRIRRSGSTPYQCVLGRSPNVPASLIEAMEGDQRQLAAQSAALVELVFYWREVKHVTSKRLQGEHGWRGLAMVLAAEGRAGLRLSYRAVPVLVAPEQDLVRQLSQWRAGPTLQKGFVGERGPGPRGGGVQRARRCKRGDGDSDNVGAAGDALAAECYPEYHHYLVVDTTGQTSELNHCLEMDTTGKSSELNHYLEMDTTCKTSKMKIHLDIDMICKMLRLATHLHLMQLGRGVLRTSTRLLCQVLRSNDLGKRGSKNLRRNLAYEGLSTDDHFLTTSKQIANDFLRVVKLSGRVVSRGSRTTPRGAFAAGGTDAAKKQVAPKKGRKLRSIPPDWQTAFEASDLEAWRKWIQQDAVEWPGEEELAGVEKADILPVRRVRTDKNQPAGGGLPCGQHPLRAKSRNIVPGDMDEQLLAGELQTNAPTLTDAATTVIIQEAASKPGWCLEQGDVDSAFLNGRYLDSSRRVYFRVPMGGMPAVPERGKLIALIGARVDEDLVAGSPKFFANQVAKLRKVHCCGKLRTPKGGFHRCGRVLKQNDNGAITCSQKECTDSIDKIPISAERRKAKGAKATAEEMAMLHSGNDQIQLLVRSTQMDLAFRLVESQARAHDGDLKAGLAILLVDNTGDHFLRVKPAKVTLTLWRSHRIKRVVRSTLAPETMAALKAVEIGDMLRQHLVELYHGLGYWTRMDDVRAIRMVEVSDCKSLRDPLQKRGAVPFEKRLLVDIESLRNDVGFNGVDVRAGDYTRCVLQTGECSLTEDPMAEQIISEHRVELKGRRGECHRSRYPRRHRPADQPYVVREGYAYFEDCVADLRYNAHPARLSPKHYRDFHWRMMLGQREDDVYCGKLENLVDWSGLGQEIFMMSAAGAGTEEIGGGAAGAGTALVVFAVFWMVAGECESQPRTREKADHNVPGPNDGDESVEVPGETEQSGGSTSRKKTTELPMDGASKLHERLKRASYVQIEHDLGDVLEDDILEACHLVAAGCSKCRRASCDAEEIPKGKGSEKGKCKSRSTCRVDPGECIHPADQLTTVGTNQCKEKVRCRLCDALLVDRDATWWSEEKELRAEVKAIRLGKQKQ